MTGVIAMACTGKKDGAAPSAPTDDPETEESSDTTELSTIDTLQLFTEKEIPKSADLLFDDFFYSFTTDRNFRSQRVTFPLHGTEAGQPAAMTREQWTYDNDFSRPFYSVIYEREGDMAIQKDTSLNSVSVEWVYLNEGRMERFHFQRTDGTWMLSDFEKEQTAQSPNSDFLQFYSQFISDSVFQRESLAEPLKLVSAWGGEEDGESEIELTPDDWFEFRKEMPMPEGVMTNINYGQPALSENRKILLVEGMGSELYVKYKFDRLDGKWRLIEIEN